MKLCLLALLCSAGATLSLTAAEELLTLKTPKDKTSYTVGMDIGRSLTNQAMDLNPEAVTAGIRAILSGAKPLLSQEEYQETLKALREEMQAKRQAKFAEMQAKQAEKQKEAGDKNKQEGEAFLVENKKKEGVKTTPSGLQYKVVTAGTGKVPTTNDTVVTHYRGTFIDHKEFDSSYKRGEPFVAPVTRLIKGWMPVGSKWQLVIPSNLAYGTNGSATIPPNSTLLFDMELLSIQDKAAAAKPAAQ